MQIFKKVKEKITKKSKLMKILNLIKERFWFYLFGTLISLYLYGIIIYSFRAAFTNFMNGTADSVFTLNPLKCIGAVFSPQGFGVIFFLFIMYALISGKWMHLITGVKITKDERNFFVSSEGTHGTSGWMTKKEQDKILLSDTADNLPCPILCKIKDSVYDDDRFAHYLGLRSDCGLNKHIMIYGATGAGKSRGFVKPLILKMVQLMLSGKDKQSMIIVDPKAGATRF